jgi:hypothetical protein
MTTGNDQGPIISGLPIPTMEQDHRSHDLDGAPEWTVQICPLKSAGPDLTFLHQRLRFTS